MLVEALLSEGRAQLSQAKPWQIAAYSRFPSIRCSMTAWRRARASIQSRQLWIGIALFRRLAAPLELEKEEA